MSTRLKKETIVGLKELRENMEVYIKRVNKGESVTVFRKNVPLFRLAPIDEDYDGQWETVINFTEIDKKGVPVEEVLASLKKMHG
jgi:prevent-host-death family protein